jgi:ribonuclease HII
MKRRRRQAAKLFRFDREQGTRFVAGCDEAGRGSLAGPLVAAAVLIDYESLGMRDRRALGELDDSKKRSPEEREELYPAVLRAATRVAVTARCVRGIDARGLHVTNIAALRRSLERVAVPGAACLVDGFRLPGCAVPHQPVIDGDARSAAIAAASVIAKVTRDRYMCRVDALYPGFGFAENAGYSTPEHRDAVIQRGPSDLHRRSFQSIAYTQLALGSGSAGSADVLPLGDPARGVDPQADDVDPQGAEARQLRAVLAGPGGGEGAEPGALPRPDHLER